MADLYTLFGEDLVHALGWTFVHSLWQGSLIALVMTALLSRTSDHAARQRYAVAMSSLAAVLTAAVVTFIVLYRPSAAVVQPALTDMPAHLMLLVDDPVIATPGLKAWISQYTPLLVSIWLLGAAFFALRFLSGLLYIRYMKGTATDVQGKWQQTLTAISGQLGYPKTVRLAQSALVRIPVVVGYFKPVILFPVGVINQLTTEEVEAILAHEMAHLVRNDFLHNIFQSLVEVIFYYHPAVWWISAVARAERENCCDDLAVQVCGNSLTYAKALVSVEDMRMHAPALALPFAANRGHLLNRIKRILNQPQTKSNVMEKFIATAILIGCVTMLSFTSKDIPVPETGDIKTLTALNVTMDTIPVRTTINTTFRGQDVEMHMQNGEVHYLGIDGTEIDPADYSAHQEVIDALREMSERTPISDPPVPPAPSEFPEFYAPAPPPVPAVPPVPSVAPIAPIAPVPPVPPVGLIAPVSPFAPIPPIPPVQPAFPPVHNQGYNETLIIREPSGGNGYSYRIHNENGNSNITIDRNKGIAIIDGREIVLDADSVFVIERVQRHRHPGLFSYGHRVSGQVTKEQLEQYEREIELWAEQWKAQQLQWEDYARQWKEQQQPLWEEYAREWKMQQPQWEEYTRLWKEQQPQWEAYAKEWQLQQPQWEQYQIDMQQWAKDFKVNDEQRREAIENSAKTRARLTEQLAESTYGTHIQGHLFSADDLRGTLSVRSTPSDRFLSSMAKEGLIDPSGSYHILLTESRLRIDGKRMPDNVHQKYLGLYEKIYGAPVTGKTRIELSN